MYVFNLGPYARTSQVRSVLEDLGLNILLYEKQTRLINSKYQRANVQGVPKSEPFYIEIYPQIFY